MLMFIDRREKDYSRHNILKRVLADVLIRKKLYVLLPFSKKKFFLLWLQRRLILNDFFISDYDTYVNDRKKGSRFSLSAMYKYLLDWFNFHYSPYLLSDTQSHFNHWQQLFGPYQGQHLVFPVLADDRIYYPKVTTGEGQPPNIFRILFYGHFIPLHGIDVILRALKMCELRGMKFEAELLGEGQTLGDMLELSAKLNLKQVVFNQTFIPETELATRIHASNLVLGIFGESTKAHSVVPNKVYQALACRSAVITQDSPAIREFFSEEDLCIVKSNPDSLARAIEDLANNAEKRQSLAAQGYKTYNRIYEQSVNALTAFVEAVDEH